MPTKTLPQYKDCHYCAWDQLTDAQQKEARLELHMQRPPEMYHYLIENATGRVTWAYPKTKTPAQLKEYERQYWEGVKA